MKEKLYSLILEKREIIAKLKEEVHILWVTYYSLPMEEELKQKEEFLNEQLLRYNSVYLPESLNDFKE